MTERGPLVRAFGARATWLLPAIVAALGIIPVAWALYSGSFAILGRDQGSLQYVAWALRHGERTYRDIHEMSGPFPQAWHALMQLLGGEDEHVFRTVDTWVLVSVYVLGASTLPRWVADADAGTDAGPGVHSTRTRLAWAAAGLTILGAQYARYDWWQTAQRESLYALLVFASLALQAVAQTTRSRRTALVAIGFAGLLTSLPWFGKPPCVVCSAMQAIILWLDRKNLPLRLREAVLAGGGGVIVAALAMLGFVAAYGDLGRGLVFLSKVPRLQPTAWNETLRGAYHAYDNAPRLDRGFGIVVLFGAAFFCLDLPRRALLALVLPMGGFAVFASQGKAHPYHLHMFTLGTAVASLVILAGVARSLEVIAGPKAPGAPLRLGRVRLNARRGGVLAALTASALFAAIGLGAGAARAARVSPAVQGRWDALGETAEQRATRTYAAQFRSSEFSPNDLRDAAAYLSFHTLPDERVQTYGLDPYLLFLARRKSASPVIYDIELNVDGALRGGGGRPSIERKRWLMDYREEAERLVLAAVSASPPAAFALVDRTPFLYAEDSERDLEQHCPRLYDWMTEHYTRSAAFGSVRIWLRRDIQERSTAR